MRYDNLKARVVLEVDTLCLNLDPSVPINRKQSSTARSLQWSLRNTEVMPDKQIACDLPNPTNASLKEK